LVLGPYLGCCCFRLDTQQTLKPFGQLIRSSPLIRIPFFIIALLLICISQVADAKEPKEFTEKFFQLVQSGKVPEAYSQLFAGSQIAAKKPQAFELLSKQTADGLPMYGNILGVELINEEKFGDTIVRLVYVLKSEIAPTIWEFYFYKPKSDWFLGKLLFNDEFNLLQRMK
jgi:hypothetical protein